MKIENLFVTWQQRSAQSNMPISVSAAQAGSKVGPKRSSGARSGLCTRGGIWPWSSVFCLNFWVCWALVLGFANGALLPSTGRAVKAGWLPRKFDPHLSSMVMLQTACSWS